jgi:hypothetical protein
MTNIAQTQNMQRFVVRLSSALDVTGDGTIYTSIYDSTVQGSGIVIATGIFTCTVAGTFLFCVYPTLTALSSAFTSCNIKVVTNLRTYTLCNFNVGGWRSQALVASQAGYCVAPLAAGDTASMTVQASGSTKTLDIFDWFQTARLF